MAAAGVCYAEDGFGLIIQTGSTNSGPLHLKSPLDRLFGSSTEQAILWMCATGLLSVRLATLPSLRLEESFWWAIGIFGTMGFAVAQTEAGRREFSLAAFRKQFWKEMAGEFAQVGVAATLTVLLSGVAVGLTLIAGFIDVARAATVFGLLLFIAAFLLVYRFVVMSISVWLGKPDGSDRGTGD